MNGDLPEPDHRSHLQALHGLASALRSWNAEFERRADQAASHTARTDYEEAQIIDIFYSAGFASLARSHALICTVAAFLESLFKANFAAVGARGAIRVRADDPRLIALGGNRNLFWNPTRGMTGEGIADRIIAILATTNLIPYFGTDFGRAIKAVFSYRNQMIHNGYEWPLDKRIEFNERLGSENWSEWFSVATSGSDPWFFTITPAFEQMCLELCDRAALAFEGLVVGDWELYDFRYGGHPEHESPSG